MLKILALIRQQQVPHSMGLLLEIINIYYAINQEKNIFQIKFIQNMKNKENIQNCEQEDFNLQWFHIHHL
jgi:hypothetical protein